MKSLWFSALLAISFHQSYSQIPNGNFENWSSFGGWFVYPTQWTTSGTQIISSETYQDPNAYQGLYALTMWHNSWATIAFPLSTHPKFMNGFFKSTVAVGDSAYIYVYFKKAGIKVDSGKFYFPQNSPVYSQFTFPLSTNSPTIDSVDIFIRGGKNGNTNITLDSLTFSYAPTGSYENEVNIYSFNIYPNPSTGTMTVNLKGTGYSSLKIIDVLGREVYLLHLEAGKLDMNLPVDIGNIPNGVYMMQVMSGKGIISKRIEVQK